MPAPGCNGAAGVAARLAALHAAVVPGLAQASQTAGATSPMARSTRMRRFVVLMDSVGESNGARPNAFYALNPSKIIWSAQRLAHRWSSSVRTVQVSSGIRNSMRASTGASAGKSRTA